MEQNVEIPLLEILDYMQVIFYVQYTKKKNSM